MAADIRRVGPDPTSAATPPRRVTPRSGRDERSFGDELARQGDEDGAAPPPAARPASSDAPPSPPVGPARGDDSGTHVDLVG